MGFSPLLLFYLSALLLHLRVTMSSIPGSSSNEEDINKPLWKYVTKFEKINEGGGNIIWQCNFCNQIKKSSYTRVKAHLLKLPGCGIAACSRVTTKDISEMQKLEEEVQLRMKANAPKKVPLPVANVSVSSNSLNSIMHGVFDSKKRKARGSGSLNPIEKAFNIGARDQLHVEIARMFYSAGLPFHLARNPHFVNALTFAANSPLTSYVPPGYNMLRTSLLQREKANIERLLQPIKGKWREKGVSIVSDGWSDSQRRPLINFMAVTESRPMFLKAVDCSGETKDKYFIANLMKEVINDVGHENVVQVITDNPPNCKGAGQIIESQFPNIIWTPCR